MASKLLFHLKKRKKPKDGTDEELAAVKAAAWAWYQHGSGSEGKVVCEFDATRTHHATRPSRYMLEAMKNMDEEAKEGPQSHTKKSLLDAYEIESISRQLDNLMESKHNKPGNGNNPADASLDNDSRRMKKKKKIKNRKWFWLRHGAAICGTGDDVINSSASALRDGRRQ